MSARVAWGLVSLGAGDGAPWLKPDERYHLRARFNRLATDAQPEVLLRSWLSGRASRHVLSAASPDHLRGDPRLVASGLSDPRSRIFAGGQAEGYVHPDDLDALLRDHLLIEGEHRNVVLHVSATVPQSPVPVLLLAADLAEHDAPRELARARELIADVLEGQRS